MHAHVAPSSGCAKVEADQAAALYREKGYDGMVITNHMWPGFDAFEAGGWAGACDALESTFIGMAKAGAREGLRILFGVELRTRETANDYLVYGLTPDTLRACGSLIDMPMDGVRQALSEYGAVIFQAHPLRTHMSMARARWLDGYEVFNGNPRHDSKNELARMLAARAGMPGIAGSDFHQICDAGTAGCLFYEHPRDEKDLARALRERRYLRVESPTDPRP